MVAMPSAARLRANQSLKWTFFDEGVLAAWVAEMDYGLAPAVSAALHDAIDRGELEIKFARIDTNTAGAIFRAYPAMACGPDRQHLRAGKSRDRIAPDPGVAGGTHPEKDGAPGA